MEEIDAIIIDSLRNLHCDIEDDISSLKQFDAEMTVTAVSSCLEAITPHLKFPKKLPPSMSHKLKLTTNLASQIKDLGYRDDIGYQTILYCNESEIRRLFMFLIEKLPRENKITHVEQTGYVPTLVKQIEQKVRDSLQLLWVPSCVLEHGYRKKGVVFHSLGHCRPLRTVNLQVPCSNSKNKDYYKDYWIRNVPVVSNQCNPHELLPSLMFKDCESDCSLRKCFNVVKDEEIVVNQLVEMPEITVTDLETEFENKLQTLLGELKKRKEECVENENSIKSFQSQLESLENCKKEEDANLEEKLSQINLKSKTLTVLSKEENLDKLKKMIETSRHKLVHLSEQWNSIQAPLLEDYKTLKNARSDKDLKHQQEIERLQKLEEAKALLKTDLHKKAQLEEELRRKLEQVNKNHSRSGYTRKILEIIGNVKKQDEEIQKILKDTREVQREISNLTGQVDRSFTLADELIFRDAKHDETSRKAYKLLAQLRDDCASIIKGVTDLGAVERECRNLQEQIDSETAKENGVKLERVNKDLQEIKKENLTLQQQS